jgi:tetratricopeptide (TPR) repeat protein
MPHRRSATLIAVAVFVFAHAAAAQRLDRDALLARGKDAYDRLPQMVTLRDAPVFSEALGYLYAYQQRATRENVGIDAATTAAIDWLLSSMASMKTGKADGMRSDDDLRNRGMAMYTKARSSDNGRVWDVTAYLAASANLYAYVQCASGPSQSALDAHSWLANARGRLATAGVAADGPVNPEGWRPAKPRPGAKSRGVLAGHEAVVGPPTPPTAQPAGGERGGRDATSDTAQKIQALTERLAKLEAENAELKRANQELEAKLAQVERERDTAAPAADRRLDMATRLMKDGRYIEASKIARTVLRSNPTSGEAHLLLARAYAAASATDTTPEGRAVAWVAMDHLTIAIKQGVIEHQSGLAEMKLFAARAPRPTDLAARGWTVGQKLRVAFPQYEWIEEETIVRQ